MGKMRNAYNFFSKILKAEAYLGGTGVDEMIILKLLLNIHAAYIHKYEQKCYRHENVDGVRMGPVAGFYEHK